MTNSGMNTQVDEFLNRAAKWREEMQKLRIIALGCGLIEEFKWGKPCYTFEGKNIIIIQPFKEYFALLFIKGALIKDVHGILVQQTENVQAGRQIRFTGIHEITDIEPAVKAYIYEAVEVEKAGLEMDFNKNKEFAIPEELQKKFDEAPDFKTAFYALTPGRQRAYILYFSQPKQSSTRESRVEKYVQQILSGKGLNN